MHKASWNDLKCVLAVAEAGSVKAASVALGVNHATVLRRIAAFEDRHGFRLFRRDPTGYRVEPSAAPILSALRTVGKDVEVVERLLASRGTALEGPVRVTSTDSLAATVLPILIRDIRRDLPGIRPSLATTNNRLNLDQSDAEVTIRPAYALPDGLWGMDAGRAGVPHLRVGKLPCRKPVAGPGRPLVADREPGPSGVSGRTLAGPSSRRPHRCRGRQFCRSGATGSKRVGPCDVALLHVED